MLVRDLGIWNVDEELLWCEFGELERLETVLHLYTRHVLVYFASCHATHLASQVDCADDASSKHMTSANTVKSLGSRRSGV